MIQKKYYKLVRVSYEDSEYLRMKNVSNENGIFKFVKTGTSAAPNIEYSLDGVTWTTYDFTTFPEITVVAGANIYFRGTNASFNLAGYNSQISFNLNKSCEAHGNFFSLFNPNPDVFSTYTTLNNCQGLFRNCDTLLSANIFSNLTTINNEGLTNAFNGCTALTTAPDLSSVTSVGQMGCYAMFHSCSSLTTAPDLSSVTSVGNSGFSNIFYNCTSLTTAPDLSSVTSVGNSGFTYSFYGCSHLSSVTTPNIDTWETSKFTSWLQNAGSQATGTKTLYKPADLTIPTGNVSGVPTGWTVANY